MFVCVERERVFFTVVVVVRLFDCSCYFCTWRQFRPLFVDSDCDDGDQKTRIGISSVKDFAASHGQRKNFGTCTGSYLPASYCAGRA